MKLRPYNCKQHTGMTIHTFCYWLHGIPATSVHIIQQHTCQKSNQSDKSCLLLLPVWHTDNSVYITQYVPYMKYVSHTEFIKICQEF